MVTATTVKREVAYDHHFDPETKRHSVNGIQTVLHCHHYSSLYTQLAIDAGQEEMLQECSRESFRTVLDTYFEDHPEITTVPAKVETAGQYYSLLGLGKMNVNFLGTESGEVELLASHTDSGWIKKWGEYDRPINYITAGYIEAMCESALGLPPRSFKATETQSIVMGSETSKFKVTRR